MKLFTLPNIITLGNLLCGCLAIVCAFNGDLVWAAYLVGIAAVLDFLDGFVARALKQHSPIGKDLDSLADMVTFGVVPGVVMFQLLSASVNMVNGIEFSSASQEVYNNPTEAYNALYDAARPSSLMSLLPYGAFLIVLFSALRLAKFNNDTRQSDSFIGVPTPANSILICSFPLILNAIDEEHHRFSYLDGQAFDIPRYGFDYLDAVGFVIVNPYFLLSIVVIMSYLLISEIPLFALKFKSFKWKGNEIRYSFLAAAVIMLVLLKYIALPLVIVLYVLMSVVNNLSRKKTST